MCVSLAVVAIGVTVAAAGVQAVSSIAGANANKANAKYENKVRTKQLNERRNIERLAALERENVRSADFRRARSAALAAIGASGLGENISFFQGADPEAQAAFLKDVRNIRLGLVAEESSIKDQIQVGAFGVKIAKFNAGMTKIGAIADFAKTAMQAASFYGANSAPTTSTATHSYSGSSYGGQGITLGG